MVYTHNLINGKLLRIAGAYCYNTLNTVNKDNVLTFLKGQREMTRRSVKQLY